MGSVRFSGILLASCFLAILGLSEAQLQLGFYAKNCPKAEKIVEDFVDEHIHNAPSVAAALIRMHFHDCFVRVCVHHLLPLPKILQSTLSVSELNFLKLIKFF